MSVGCDGRVFGYASGHLHHDAIGAFEAIASSCRALSAMRWRHSEDPGSSHRRPTPTVVLLEAKAPLVVLFHVIPRPSEVSRHMSRHGSLRDLFGLGPSSDVASVSSSHP